MSCELQAKFSNPELSNALCVASGFELILRQLKSSKDSSLEINRKYFKIKPFAGLPFPFMRYIL